MKAPSAGSRATKVDAQMLDGLVAEYKTPADVEALYTRMLQRVINRSLNAEMDAHLGYAGHAKGDSGERGNTHGFPCAD